MLLKAVLIIMNKNVKKLWVKALCSGKYEQGEGRLCQQSLNKFCCMGVLADVAFDSYWVNQYWFELSIEDLEKVGLTEKDQEILIQMNDGVSHKNYSFAEIADYIEKNL
jgi:hypothetical protein